jgi:hypothetical protein
MKLSRTTSSRIDWSRIEDPIGLLTGQFRTANVQGLVDRELSEEDRRRVQAAFAATRTEFADTLKWLRLTMKAVSVGMIVAAGTVVVGGLLLQLSPWAGLISLVALGTIIGLTRKVWSTAREEVMLELLPRRYELAAALCRTTSEMQMLSTKFLEETSSLRGGEDPSQPVRKATASKRGVIRTRARGS